jgi:hypothetical protein
MFGAVGTEEVGSVAARDVTDADSSSASPREPGRESRAARTVAVGPRDSRKMSAEQ